MGGVARFVGDVVGGAADLVGDVVSGVGDAVVDVGDFVVDEIIDPVVSTVGNVIQAALDDPIKTIAQVAAVVAGQPELLPLIEGADVAIAGGDISDVLAATAKAYVMQEVGQYVGKAAGAYAGEAATNAGASAAAAEVAENVVGAAAGRGAVAVVTGQDPIKAMVQGGISAGTSAILGQIPGFTEFAKNNRTAANVISAGVMSALTGQNPTTPMVQSLIASSGIVQDVLKSFDPTGTKLDKAQTAIVTDILMGTATAALTGGNPSNVVKAAMLKAGSKALGDMVTDAFKSSTKDATTAYENADAKAAEMDVNRAAQEDYVNKYNGVRNDLQARVDEQNRLIKVANDTKAALEADPKNQAKYDAAVAAKTAADNYITQLNKDYAETYKPKLDDYGAKLDTLKQNYAVMEGDYEKAIQAFATKTDTLTEKLDPLFFTSDRAFVEAMSPGFNADEYRKLNGLGADVNVYDHYLGVGQFENAPTNAKAAEAELSAQRTRLVNEALTAKGVNITTADPAQVAKILDNIDATYGNNVAALRGASAQDILSGNTAPLNQLVKDQQDGVLRIEVSGHAYGQWSPPPSDKFTMPAGLRLATQEEFNNGSATLQYGDNGIPVWVAADPNTAPQNWDAATGNYTTSPPTVVVTAPRPTEADKLLAYGTDPTSWSGIVSQAVLNGAQTLVGWAKESGNSTLINTAANVIKAGGGFLESINGISVLAGYAPGNTALGKFSTALQNLGKANNTAEYQAAIKNMQNIIGNAKGVGGTLEAIYGAFKSAPLEFLAEYVGVEGIQEVAPLLIGGVAASGAKGVALALKYGQAVATKMGTAAGMTASILSDITESAGGAASSAYTDAYNTAKKAGKSDAEADKIALDIAQRAAFVAGGTTAVTMGIGGAALEKAILGKSGTGVGDALQALGDFAKTGSKITIKEGLSEAGEEGITQAFLESQLYKLDPTRDVAGNITAAAAFGAIAGGPIAGGAYGASRTGDVISNALLGNAEVANIVNNSGSAADAAAALNNLGLSDSVTQANLLNTKYDSQYTSSDEAAAALAKHGDFVYSDADVAALTGNTSNLNLANVANQYVDERVFDIEEVKAAAKAEGYTITDEQAAALIGQKNEAEATAAARTQFDPLATTYEEAKALFKDTYGYTPTYNEVQSFVKSVSEEQAKADIGAYVDPRQVTFDEAKQYLIDNGYTPSDADVQRLVGQVNEADQATKIAEWADPRVVDEQEVRDAYAVLGLVKPTQADVAKLVGQYDESDLAGKAQANLDPARYNSIMEQLDGLTTGASQEVLDAVALVKNDLNSQITALGGDIATLSGDVATAKADLLGAIKDAQTGNTERFGDIDKAIQDLKDAGLSEQQVQDIVDQSTSGLSKDFKDALAEAVKGNADALDTVKTDLEAKIGDVQTALETALSGQTDTFNAKVKDLMDQGKSYQEATEKALADMGVQITDLGTDFATKLDDVQTALGTQITDLSTQLADVETNIYSKMAEYEKAGIARDVALSKAIADVATDLGTTKADLLSQMGTTEANLKSEFATQLGAVQTQIGDVQTALTQAIADAQAAGLQGDAALQAAIDSVAGSLGTTKADLLSQMGTTEAQLRSDFATQIGDVQTQIGDVQKAIADQMAAYEAAGVARDDALSLAITDVSGQLGTTKTELLAQLGTTEANLKAEIAAQVGGVAADVQAKYDALTAEQKALADQLAQQGVDLNTAIAQAQQQTQQQITDVQQDVQTKYDALAQGQKDLATQLAQQGFDLNTAIELARQETQQGFTDVFGQIAANQTATQQAIADAAAQTQAKAAEEAAATRAAQQAAALKTQRMGNINTMMGMLSQAPDVGGQQVTVKAADPAKIGYIYDWNSIFANPSQEKMFASPYGAYAQGGMVQDEVADVNDELLKILRG